MAENKLNDMIETSLGKIREIAGTDTVIGDPIWTPNGTMILPVSKVSMGFASGGLDFGAKKADKDQSEKKPDHFGGGGGTGVSITPIAFLILSPDGKTELVPITAPQNIDTVDKVASLIERSPDILARLKNVFAGKKKKDKKEKKGGEEETKPSAEETAEEKTED